MFAGSDPRVDLHSSRSVFELDFDQPKRVNAERGLAKVSGRGAVVSGKRWRASAVCFAMSMCALPAQAYRTGEDSAELSGKGRIAWVNPDVSFYLSRKGLPAGISEAVAEDALSVALAAWQAPECSAVRPTFAGWVDDAPAPRDDANTVAWVSDWAARGLPKSVPGNTELTYRGLAGVWQIAEADVLLNAADFDWAKLSLATVLTHELGHALGLQHPCEDQGADGAPLCSDASDAELASVMYPDYDPTHGALGVDDVAGICYLYPPEQACQGGCGLNEVCIDRACHATCRESVCAVGEACGAWGCTPASGCLEADCEGHGCKNDGECGPLLRCSAAGLCYAGASPWGEECLANADCADGACIAGACQPLCQLDSQCGQSGSCVNTDDKRVSACVASGAYQLGARCAMGEDCQSGLCLFTAERSTCTLSCSDAGSTCPKDWSCGTVEQQRVCIPAKPGEGGCSLALPAAATGRTLLGGRESAGWILAATAFLATRKLRRKKQR